MKTLFLTAATLLSAMVVAQDRPRVDTPLTTEQAIQFGLRYHPAIRAALANQKEASSSRSTALSKTGPVLAFNGFGSEGNESAMITNPPGADPLTHANITKSAFWDLNLTLMVPLYTGGVLAANVQSAVWAERAVSAEVQEARADVALNVTEAYLQYLKYKSQAADISQKLVAQQEVTRVAQASYQTGKEIRPNVRRAEAEESVVKRELQSVQNELQKALLRLCAAMGVDQTSHPAIVENLEKILPAAKTLDEYVTVAKQKRPLLASSRAQVKSAQAAVLAAQGALKPQLYGFVMADHSNDEMSRGAVVGLTVSIPLFDSGLRHSQVNQARARRERAQADLDLLEIQVESEVRQAYMDYDTAVSNYKLAVSAIDPILASYRAVSLRYQAGKATMLEQIEGLAKYAEVKSQQDQAAYERLSALARLERASGLLPHEASNPTTKPEKKP